MKPKQSDMFRENAQNCADKAESAKDKPSYNRFKRMEATWLALAEEQDWLDGEKSPVDRSSLTGTDKRQVA
jgi:hypothetical protein